ncbi:hypothetical protein NEAUS07_0876 [Nematocida ausubeli]|nr:hypothetical protein NEAUS07_0876 [Nematocida ausubeli]
MAYSKEERKKRIRNLIIIGVVIGAVTAVLTGAYVMGYIGNDKGKSKKEKVSENKRTTTMQMADQREPQTLESLLIWTAYRAGNNSFLARPKLKLDVHDKITVDSEIETVTHINKMESAIETLLGEYKKYADKNPKKRLPIVIHNVIKKNYHLRYILSIQRDPMEALKTLNLLDKNNKCSENSIKNALNWLLKGHEEGTISKFKEVLEMDMDKCPIENDIYKMVEVLLKVVVSSPFVATRRRGLKNKQSLIFILREILSDMKNLKSYISLKNQSKGIISMARGNTTESIKKQIEKIEMYRQRLLNNHMTEEEITLASMVSLVGHVQRAANIDNESYFIDLVQNIKAVKKMKAFNTLSNKSEKTGESGEEYVKFFIEFIKNYIAMHSTKKSAGIFTKYLEQHAEDIDRYVNPAKAGTNPEIKSLGTLLNISTKKIQEIEEISNFTDRLITLICLETDYMMGKNRDRYILYEILNCYRELMATEVKYIKEEDRIAKRLMNSSMMKNFMNVEKVQNQKLYAANKEGVWCIFPENFKKDSDDISTISRALEHQAANLSMSMLIFDVLDKKTKEPEKNE